MFSDQEQSLMNDFKIIVIFMRGQVCQINHFNVLSGRIKAIQLEYTEAHKNLLQAIRKAPQHTAVGFKQTVS